MYQVSDLQQKEIEEKNPIREFVNNKIGTWPVNLNNKQIMVTEGMLTLMDLITRNTLHVMNNKVFMVSAYAYILNFNFVESLMISFQHLLSSGIFPTALSMCLPIFMYIVAEEKQAKLKVVMQMHGLKEWCYWLAFMLNNIILYLLVYFSFYLVGRFVMNVHLFMETDGMLMVDQS